ncbi:MAG: Ig-like domain-containing protein [Mycobacterium sp.]|nr:Ig-like domain-containing protein [Mycobacterium sp.]
MATALGVGAAMLCAAPGLAFADDSAADSAAPAGPGRGGAPSLRLAHRPSGALPAARQRSLGQTRAIAPAAATTAAATTASPSAASVRRDPISSLLDNAAPSVGATQTGQSNDGVITGVLGVTDPDGDAAGAAVTSNPGHGRVVLNGLQYTYTPDPLMAHTAFTDTFTVVASDAGSGFHIHGLLGVINLLTFGLLGTAGHTTTSTVRVSVAPFNNAPTATVRVDPPDPVTGVVTGAVMGSDVNGDTLTYTGSASTENGAVTVSATGGFTYSPATLPRAQDTFTVTVDDGYGGLLLVPVTITTGQPAPSGPLSTFCGCTLMPADTVFHADIRGLPVLAQSATWTALLGGNIRAVWGGGQWMGSTAGMPVNTVSADRAVERVIFNRGLTTSGPTIDDRPYAIPDYPLVEGMLTRSIAVDFAEAGVRYDMNSGLYPVIGEANASQLPYLPLILRPDDLERGSIDHMLGITIAKDRGTGYTWPARSGDGTGTNPDGVPMGTVLRLRADFDVSSYDPATQVVLRALQEHGAVIYDSGSPGQDGATLLAMSNGWSGTGYLTAQRELSTVPLSAFEAVDVLSLASDPRVGWVIG